MNAMQVLLSGVTELTTVSGSAQKFLANLAAELKAVSDNAGAVSNIADMLASQGDQIGKHLLANVPVVTAHYQEPDTETTPVPTANTNEAGLRTDGPTFEQYVDAGYPPANYPPGGYVEKPSAGLDAYRAEQASGTSGVSTDTVVTEPKMSATPASQSPTDTPNPPVITEEPSPTTSGGTGA